MQRRIKFVVALLFTISVAGYTQTAASSIAFDKLIFNTKTKITGAYYLNRQKFSQQVTTLKNSLFLPIISSNFYTKDLGFFCKKELAIEKRTRFPVRFRLGSLQYCNQLEGK